MGDNSGQSVVGKSDRSYYSKVVLSGVIAGLAEVLVNHPLWVVKTRMQMGSESPWRLRGLYRGLFSNITSMVPLIASRLFLANYFQRVLFNDEKLENYQLIVSGLLGGAIPSLVSGPLELIRTKEVEKNTSFISTIQRITKRRGVVALGSGMLGTAARDGLYTAGFFALYPGIRNKMDVCFPENSSTNALLSKPLAGAVAAFSSQPLDTIKIYQQINCEKTGISTPQAFKNIMSQHGFRGFFMGATPRIFRVISAITIISTVNEEVIDYLNERDADNGLTYR